MLTLGENGQIYVAEFQVICSATPPSREWGITPHSLSWLFSKKYSMERVTLQWRNVTNSTLCQVIKVNITVISHVDSMYPCCDMIKLALYLCFLPQPCYPCVIMGNENTILQNILLVILKTIKVIVTGWTVIPTPHTKKTHVLAFRICEGDLIW